jgi:hypothetical protein
MQGSRNKIPSKKISSGSTAQGDLIPALKEKYISVVQPRRLTLSVQFTIN